MLRRNRIFILPGTARQPTPSDTPSVPYLLQFRKVRTIPSGRCCNIASLTTPALSIPFFAHLSMHSEKSAISLSLMVLLCQP